MNITKSELYVMEALWQEQPLTVGQVIERVRANTDWHDNTIKTVLTRLTEKQAVSRFKDGRRYFYQPRIEREQVIETQAQGLLSRFFGGQMAPLIAHFADQKKLSAQDIAEIENILNQTKNDDN